MHVCVSVCCYYFANPSTLCVCLPVCTCTCVCPDACIYNAEVLSMCNKHLMLGQTPVMYTHTYTHSHTFNTFTQAQHSVNSHEEHANSPKRWKPGKSAGWQGRQLVVTQFKAPVSRRNRELGRQLSCILRKANIHESNTWIQTETQWICMIVWGASKNQRHTRHHRISRVCQWSLHVRMCVCWQLSCMLIKVDKQKTDFHTWYTIVKHKYDCVFTQRKGKR